MRCVSTYVLDHDFFGQVHGHQRGYGEYEDRSVQLLRRCPRWLGCGPHLLVLCEFFWSERRLVLSGPMQLDQVAVVIKVLFQ